MYEAYKRILNALNLEKHLTARQITRLLYPQEYASDETRSRAYQRVSRNLQYLRAKSLLKSKSYGLSKEEGSADYLWSLRQHPIIKEMELEPPRSEVHSFKYKHERDCGEVFVSLALTGRLYGWEAHRRIAKGIIPDRHGWLENLSQYIERERGTQDKVESKTLNYMKHFRETKEPFDVLYVVNSEREVEDAVEIFYCLGCTDNYQAAVFNEFVSDPLACHITTAKRTFQLHERIQ